MSQATPGQAEDSLIFQPASYVEPIDPDELFSKVAPLEIEVGTGDGGFLLAWARQHPDRNFIGIERLLGRLRKLDRKGRRAGLTNLRLLRLEAGYFLGYLVPPGSVAALHIYFPDPWPKKRQRKHRLIQPPFGETAARVLRPGGTLYVRTDDRDYFGQMQEVFGAVPSLEPAATPPELSAVATEFEQGFAARGIAAHQAAWRRT